VQYARELRKGGKLNVHPQTLSVIMLALFFLICDRKEAVAEMEEYETIRADISSSKLPMERATSFV
jgi:hypothetical protein